MTIMSFYFKCVCFSWILRYVCFAADNTSIPECPAEKFGLVNFGHSGLLVTWNPDQIDHTEMIFTWYPYPNEQNFTSNNFSYEVEYGQFRISSLKENTNYRIEIGIKVYEPIEKFDQCWITGKTINKTNNSLLNKPDFEVHMYCAPPLADFSYVPYIRIEWLPCGRKGYCEGEEVAGSHFLVKYKMLESRQVWKTYEYDRSTKFIYGLVPGRIYEIAVTSIVSVGNVDFEIESDPQEVFITPDCSPVRNVKIITTSNSSVLISWEPPKHCQEEFQHSKYIILYRIFDNNTTVFFNYSFHECPYKVVKGSELHTDNPSSIVQHMKITELLTGARYTFFIFPNRFSFEYRIDHTILYTNELRLPLAKPDFYYVPPIPSYIKYCSVEIFWYPCGRTYDCTSARTGSHFLVTYRNLTDGLEQKYNETNREFCKIHLELHQNYTVKVQSGDEFGYSEFSDEKIIECP